MSSHSTLKVRQVAWRNLTTTLRKEGITPNPEIVGRKAKQAISAAISSEGISLPAATVIAMREQLTASIMKNWNATKARSTPDKARDQRRAEAREIALETVVATSRRRLAAERGTSKSRVQRALVESGLARPWAKAPLSPHARYLLEVVAFNVPPESRRAVSSAELCSVAGVSPQRLAGLFDEINGARIGFHLVLTSIRSDTGPCWVVAIRGRRSTPEKLEEWLRRSELKRAQRNRLRPDQKNYAIGLAAPARGLTEADVYAVLDVIQETRNILQWKRFIDVTGLCIGGEEGDADLDAIVSVVRSAMKLNEATIYSEGMMSRVVGWVNDPPTRTLAEKIMSLAESLVELSQRESLEAVVRKWAQQIDYLGSINSGRLPGRSSERATFLLEREEILDEDLVLESPGTDALPFSQRQGLVH